MSFTSLRVFCLILSPITRSAMQRGGTPRARVWTEPSSSSGADILNLRSSRAKSLEPGTQARHAARFHPRTLTCDGPTRPGHGARTTARRIADDKRGRNRYSGLIEDNAGVHRWWTKFLLADDAVLCTACSGQARDFSSASTGLPIRPPPPYRARLCGVSATRSSQPAVPGPLF